MTPDEDKKRVAKSKERWHYLAIKKLSALLRGIISKRGDFCCLNWLHFYATEKKTTWIA